MEHVINLTFNFDDADIVNRVINMAVQETKEEIMKKIIREIGDPNSYYSYNWNEFVKKIASEAVEPYKEQIVEAASIKLSDKLSRTKVVKEKVGEILEGM